MDIDINTGPYNHGVETGTGKGIVGADQSLCGCKGALKLGLGANAIRARGAVVEAVDLGGRRDGGGHEGEELQRLTHGEMDLDLDLDLDLDWVVGGG